jgi:hypothetical protein
MSLAQIETPNKASQETGIYGIQALLTHFAFPPLTTKRRRHIFSKRRLAYLGISID